MKIKLRKMSRLVAELHAQFSSLLSRWERPGEGACISAKLEQAIKANQPARRSAQRKGGRGLGYGG
jgi:hypothetical protein